jgi:hypothetical protein
MISTSPHVYWRNITIDCVCASTRDNKYRGLPLASMKIGYRVWFNTVAVSCKTLAVAEGCKLAQMALMLDAYEVVILLMVLLTVVMRLSRYTTTLCMVKVSGCRRESEMV